MKFIVYILAFLLIFSFFGCGKKDSDGLENVKIREVEVQPEEPEKSEEAGKSAPEEKSEKAENSGLVIEDQTVGEGEAVVEGDTVKVHYTGLLKDGTCFDSSKKRSQPFTFTVGEGRVIEGWEKGLIGMKVGGKRLLTIPPEMGYGDRDMGDIPPNSTLYFEIELLDIAK